MTKRDIIVAGASAGGIEALFDLVRGLPPDLPAAMFLTVHIPSWQKSELPTVLCRESQLPAVHPVSGQCIEKGHIYVAPPDHHLLIDQGRIQLWRGPKENRHRPSINALFRSAAISYGARTVGIILSGVLDDGATGLWWVKRFGGVTVVQDPEDSRFPDMPCAALEHVSVDYVVKAAGMGPLVTELVLDEWTLGAAPREEAS